RIVTRGDVTTIRQGSQRVVIDWASFDIDPNDVVRFLQPGSDAVALNRILSGMPTHIRGKLTANGNVWLVNPSGVMFHAGSVADVGGLIATTAGIDPEAFMAGSGRFDRPGEPGAAVVNEGTITFAEAGLVGLVAPRAENRGTIRGKLGRIVIAGQESLSVDVSGEGLFEIDLRDAAKVEGARAGNSGVILAEGGTVIISAAAARDAVEAAVSVSGVVVASSARVEGGTIVLDGGAGGVEVSGRLEAGSAVAGGGRIDATGGRVTLTGTARLDVSGATGGGRVRLGGDVAAIKAGRAPELAEARRTEIEAGARIRADATDKGRGGEVLVWSSEATLATGWVSARGGRAGGDGGFVELSSRMGLGFAGQADLSA
ncbi:MAG: filamentous hemagglutinin N-terminal domain-containing protein, partial [Pseudomonadota bacterium]|nr:filamentous hemagglutinin N-terminal domain-containing protein [Pseudomonadota bacterium]